MNEAVQSSEGHQQHPLTIYLWIWVLLFVLSAFSYMVDYFHLKGMLRWSLIITFMLLKAGFIVAIFMHMAGSGLRSSSRSCCRRCPCSC
jgi:cytochrome c oxidase subunit IV